jgi:hypothetical protein
MDIVRHPFFYNKPPSKTPLEVNPASSCKQPKILKDFTIVRSRKARGIFGC